MTIGPQTPLPYDLPEAVPVRTVAIVGAGMMGAAIAAANVKCGLPVILSDSNPESLATAARRVAAQMTDGAGSPPAASAVTAVTAERMVTTTTELSRIGACDLILETIAESVAAKQQLFAELEPHLSPGTTLASNTSTIPISTLAAGLRDGSRLCGLHFFHPVRRRPLVEVVRGPGTSARSLATAVAYARTIDKVPLVVNDGPGFLVNRLLLPYLSEAFELLLEGATIEQIERAATDFGMAMGPLRLADEIGLDTLLHGGRVLWQAFYERIVPSPLLVTMYKAGRHGRKVGMGFFAYPEGISADEPGQPDPRVAPIIAGWARGSQSFTAQQITSRLFLTMVLEATRILQEKTVSSPREIDTGVVLGLGFPPARGGLLHWADRQGARQIVVLLRQMGHLGRRVEATPLLLEMARRNTLFYGCGS